MTSGADLFVVCKQCGSEVSPYVTECPYCGNRLRRRAPKLPRLGEDAPHVDARHGLGRLLGRGGSRPRRRPRVATSTVSRWSGVRPHATIALVAAACAMYVVERAEPELYFQMPIIGSLHGSWWRLLTYEFNYYEANSGVYALVAIAATGLFGWLLEQRHGPIAVLLVFFAGGVTGALVALAAYPLPTVSGANAAALALLAAWAVPDLRAARAGEYYEGDLLGAGAFAGLLAAIPFASPGASWLAGLAGALLGLALGYSLGVLREGVARSGE